MIQAHKGGPWGWLMDGYVSWKFRSAFRGLWVRGALPADETPRLVYMNHSSWWDGFVFHQLCQSAGWDGYCLMEEQNLARFRFLSRLGAFSIRKQEAASSLASLRYARHLLSLPRAAVLIFPEGELRSLSARPLSLARGVEVLAKGAQVICQPLAVRYAFLEHELPDVLLQVGEPHPPGPLALFQRGLEETLLAVEGARSLEGFERKVRGRRGVAERWDALRQVLRPTRADA